MVQSSPEPRRGALPRVVLAALLAVIFAWLGGLGSDEASDGPVVRRVEVDRQPIDKPAAKIRDKRAGDTPRKDDENDAEGPASTGELVEGHSLEGASAAAHGFEPRASRAHQRWWIACNDARGPPWS